MRSLFCLIVVGCVATGCVATQGVAAQAAPQPQRTIPCREIIDYTTFPYLGNSVLGAVSLPAYLVRAYPTLETPWRYFAKHGIVVKSGTSVTITVPPAWRNRVAISWGNNVHRVFHTIRIPSCGSNPKRGNAYAGGFFLSSSSACVPLVFIVGSREQKVWFGVGRRCR
jgi:hypothetical protein